MLEVITGSGELMKEIDRRLRVSDQVIRHLRPRGRREPRHRARAHAAQGQTRSAGASPVACRRSGSPAKARSGPKMTTTGLVGDVEEGMLIMREGRGRSSSSDSRGGRGGDKKDDKKRTLFRRRKVCKFCADKIDDINYKDVKLLGPFVPERGKILPRRISGTCATHQRKLQTAIKRARQLALIPYVTE